MEEKMTAPVQEGEERKSSVSVVAEVLTKHRPSSKFLKNVGLQPNSTGKSSKSNTAINARVLDLQEKLEMSRQRSEVMREEMDAMKRKAAEAEAAQAERDKSYELLLKKAEENDANANAARKSAVGFYELKNKKGDFSMKVTNWGAALVSAIVPDSKGNLADVVLGYDTAAEYMRGSASFGATVGRVSNRIANACFVLDRKTYHLLRNDGNNTIHGGPKGFGKVIWTVKEHVSDGDSPYITFYYNSLDGEQGTWRDGGLQGHGDIVVPAA
ncbi:aldose 1-epimerase-like [Hordeum vulgare]|nr:aldose 1-epimerase-like [Hordeum vulgare]